jgi:hypothetical protein
MRSIKWLFFCLILIAAPEVVNAHDCRCVQITNPKVDKEQGTVTFTVSNRCLRRVWFSTKGFWMTMSDEQEDKIASQLYKLTGDHPKFLLLKWKSEQQLTFHSDKLTGDYDKMKFSYSNTTDSQPKSMLGTKTYLCEVGIK